MKQRANKKVDRKKVYQTRMDKTGKESGRSWIRWLIEIDFIIFDKQQNVISFLFFFFFFFLLYCLQKAFFASVPPREQSPLLTEKIDPYIKANPTANSWRLPPKKQLIYKIDTLHLCIWILSWLIWLAALNAFTLAYCSNIWT